MMIAMREAGGMMGAVIADPAAQRYVWRIARHFQSKLLTMDVLYRGATASASVLVTEMDTDAVTAR
jgi:H+/gluconate symporter-like permease